MPQPWLESMDVPARPQPPDLNAFFGIPPDPVEKLDANIAKKRRYWRGKERTQVTSEKARRKVEEATRIIDELERILKRGVVDPDFDLERLREDFAHEPETHVDELGDLWRILEELVAGGRLDEALRVANEARERFRGSPVADAAFGWLAMVASRGGGDVTDRLRREGLAALEAAIANGTPEADTFTAKAILELDLGRPEAALDTFAAAERALDSGLTPWMHSHRVEAFAALGRPEEALDEARRAIGTGTDDLGLRSNTVTALIIAARTALLPIESPDGLRRYADLIEWAAYFAIGVPEAEDRVRPYRLWAVEAESLAYTGSPELRTIAAVASGFLLLPVLNRVKTKPHWQILWEGPTAETAAIFETVTYAGIARQIHDGLQHKLPWAVDSRDGTAG